MNLTRNMPKLVLVALAAMSVLGCAGLRGRVPPPGSSLDSLMGPQIEVPVEGIPGTTVSPATSLDVNVPTAGAAAPGFTPAGIEVPAAGVAASPTAPASSAYTLPAPSLSLPADAAAAARTVKAPDSGWKSINNTTRKVKTDKPIIRGQSPGGSSPPVTYPGGIGDSQPIPAQNLPGPGGFTPAYGNPGGVPVGGVPGVPAAGPTGFGPSSVPAGPAPAYPAPGFGPGGQSFYQPAEPGQVIGQPFEGMNPVIAPDLASQPTPVDVLLEETRTGRFMFGVGVNSDLGVTGNITVDERNFNIMNPPTSWDDVLNGTAWRGAGQGFRLEAQPGNRVQRYMVSFTEPYLFNTPVSSSLSGYYFDRNYFDWFETRLGGRVGLGYRITPDLSVSTALRAEDVNIFQPRVNNVALLNRSLGHTDLFGAKVALMHDTRDIPFFPTEGHLIDVSYEQVFGEFDFPRFEADWAQYFMLKERPDGSGRHTLALTLKYGMLGTDAPIFENYFAGGFSSLRGFSFRGASPSENTVRVGGRLQLLGSAEYFFPLTADDMIKAVAFCDFGTVERDLRIRGDDFRVAPGFGFRINVPALGPAPLAFDFAFPVAYAPTDQRQVFSFYVGFARQ